MKIISICTLISLVVFIVLCDGEINSGWNITFNPKEVIAVPGVCAHISCTFTHPNEAKSFETIQWKVCDKKGQCNTTIFKEKVQENNLEEIETERIKMLNPDLSSNNCSIIIKDIKADETQYVFIIEDQQQKYNSAVNISIKGEPKVDVPLLSEGVKVNLSCSAPSPCTESSPKITWWIRETSEEKLTNLESNITLKTNKHHHSSYLTLIPTSDLHNATVGCNVSYGNKNLSTTKILKVNYVQVQILGENTLTVGDTLNLNCTINNQPQASPSDPEWSFNGTTFNQTSAGILIIANVGKQHVGIYVCKIAYMNKPLNASITINITERAMGTTTPAVLKDFLTMPSIFTFVAGMAFSALIFSVILCCWVCCHRGKKQKVPTVNPDVEINLEMVQTDVAQTGTAEQTLLYGSEIETVQTDVAQIGTTEQTPLHEQPYGETSPATPTDGAEEDEAAGTEGREVDYASIDYSLLKDKPPEEAETEPTDTDYAEIKKDRTRDRKDTEDPQDGDEQVETFDQKEMGAEEELYSQVPQ